MPGISNAQTLGCVGCSGTGPPAISPKPVERLISLKTTDPVGDAADILAAFEVSEGSKLTSLRKLDPGIHVAQSSRDGAWLDSSSLEYVNVKPESYIFATRLGVEGGKSFTMFSSLKRAAAEFASFINIKPDGHVVTAVDKEIKPDGTVLYSINQDSRVPFMLTSRDGTFSCVFKAGLPREEVQILYHEADTLSRAMPAKERRRLGSLEK